MRTKIFFFLILIPILLNAQENKILDYQEKMESYYCSYMHDYYPENKLDTLNDSLFLINNKEKLFLLQLTDSVNIKLIDSFIGTEIRDYEKKDSIIYVATITNLIVLKASETRLDILTIIDYPYSGFIRDFQLKDTLLIAATRFTNGQNNIYYFSIFNISNPINPILLSSLKCSKCHYTTKVFLDDTIAYLTSDYVDTRMVSFSDPSNPYLISYIDTSFNENTNTLPLVFSEYLTPSLSDIFADGDYIFTAFNDLGVSSIENGDCVTLKGNVNEIYGYNNLLFIPNGSAGVSLLYYDYKHLVCPLTLIDFIKLDGEISSLIVDYYIIYASNSNNKIDILYLSDCENYSTLEYYESIYLSAKPLNLIFWSDYLFVSSNDTTIKIINCSTHDLIATIELSEICNKQIIKDSILYLELKDRVEIFDISKITNPIFINSVNTYSEYNSIEIYKNYLIISAGTEGIRVMDVSDLLQIYEIDYDSLNCNYANKTSVVDYFLYVTDDKNNIYKYLLFSSLNDVQDNRNDSDVSLKQNYPNPCNDNTVIEFTLNSPSKTKLSIYDISGKEILNLLNKYLPIGHYYTDISLKEIPNGIYIYTLNTDAIYISRKMIINK